MANRFEVSTIFSAIDRMSAPISRMQNRIGIMTHRVSRNIRGIQRATGRALGGLKKMGQAGIVAGALLLAPLAAATTAGINFEQTMVNAAAKYPGEIKKGTEEFARLEAAAMRTGATTEFSATQSAEAINFLAMAGFSAKNSIAALPGVVNLATASSTDLGTATDIATDSLGALGLMTKDTTQLTRNLSRVNDVLAKTTTSANVTMEDMFESIKDGAPVGVAAGQSFETIATLIAKMGDAGIKGTRGGTALKNMFLAIGAPGSEAAEVMRRLGVQTVDANGNVRDAIAVFKDFSAATEKLPSGQKLAVFDAIFGKIPIAAALNVTKAAGSMDAFRDSLLAANGTAEKMAGTMRDTTRGSLNSLKSAVEGVSIELFAMNEGPMKEAIDNAAKWVRANGPLIAQKLGQFFLDLANNIDKVVSALKTIGIVVAVLWTLNTVLSVVQGTMTVIGLLMAANPIVLGAIAIAAAAAGIYLAWEPLKAFFADLFDGIGLAFDATIGKFLEQIAAIKRTFSEFNFTDPDAYTSSADRSKPSAYATGGLPGVSSKPSAYATAGVPPAAPVVPKVTPKVSSPLDRQASIIEERNTTNKTEVVIRDETGRASAASNAAAVGLTVQSTGYF